MSILVVASDQARAGLSMVSEESLAITGKCGGGDGNLGSAPQTRESLPGSSSHVGLTKSKTSTSYTSKLIDFIPPES
jgi:hypothetical protein